EERLVVIATINSAVIQQTRDAAKADQTKIAVGNSGGSKNGEVGPAPPIDREFVDRSLVDIRREVLLGGIDYRRLSTDVYRSGHGTDGERDFKIRLASDFNHHVVHRRWTEPRRVDGHGIISGLETRDLKASGVVGRGRVFLVGAGVLDSNGSTRNDLLVRVGDHASDRAGGSRLRKCDCAHREYQQAHKTKLHNFRHTRELLKQMVSGNFNSR